ncbi:MAG: HNH endonuclease [Alphaproteobacteria bacterium]|jgi:5-methylcytosine-specific restriction protein A|nr:HNH endonuclease [Alphaproteobacteria bacterium]MBU1278042.1 HNH endonuclease [Alphaproteobacteria bacterium]MBU1572029.1 HNH endonuclease [Alphaproteobacteria bacterium]MBU1828351.1 HNH endonuclease [Alphaproteobacteria bacterium]MBU2078150.1 HNH endonuclease [Alphaproteobacteria bacterium]
MISGRQEKIRAELEAGTGAAIGMAVDQSGLRTGLRLWFDDLDDRHGPVVEMKPFGMRGYRVTLGFGKFAGEVIRQIQAAGPDDVGLARALVNSIDDMVELDLSGQARSDWLIDSGAFKITATARGLVADPDDAVTLVSRDIIVPLMAAMAELIGYDVIVEEEAEEAAFEGAILVSTVRRRERNPRNRLLCIRVHGEKCVCCGFEPKSFYGETGSIIEVHHLEALSLLDAPKQYDPATDLVPLCPNCHRAVHTRRPVPLPIEDVQKHMRACGWQGGSE